MSLRGAKRRGNLMSGGFEPRPYLDAQGRPYSLERETLQLSAHDPEGIEFE
jgi:hypothetical protein